MKELARAFVCAAVIGPELRSNALALSCDRMRILLLMFVFHFSTVSVDGDLGFKAPNQINKKCSSARFRLDGLDWGFRLMSSSLLSVNSGGFEVI